MAKHLTDLQKKKIIADRVENMSIRQLAQKHKVSTTTIQRVIKENPELTQIITQKKEQNTADILSFMEGKKQDVCDIISLYLEYLKDTSKLDRASVQSIATSLGIVIDKFTSDDYNVKTSKVSEEDDPLTQALKEEAEHGVQ